jgi:hypothetical protein
LDAVSDNGDDDELGLFMSGFFEELQRRKVYRVAAAYIIAAAFIIQIGSAVFPAWELPNWTLRLVIVLLLIGFPIALILAWAYDVTPQGIQATPRVPGAHRRRGNFCGCGIFSAAARLGAQGRQVGRRAALSKSERSKGKRVFCRGHPE